MNLQDHSRRNEYASADEFCAIFMRDQRSLYALSLLLTADKDKAEECLVRALEDCQKKQIFKPWANSWSRLSVIERAVRTIMPGRREEEVPAKEVAKHLPGELANVVRLDAVRRFVYVLTVLEKYSVRDAAILLRLGKREISAAKEQAMRLLGQATEQISNVLPESLPMTLTA